MAIKKADLLNSLSNAGFSGMGAHEAERASIKKALVRGQLSQERGRAYKIGVIAFKQGFAADAEGFAKAAQIYDMPAKKRTKQQKSDYDAAANRLSRHLKALGVAASDPRGRVRGSTVDATEAPSVVEGAPEAAKAPEAAPAASKAPLVDLVIPKIATVADADMMLVNLAAFATRVAAKYPAKFDGPGLAAVRKFAAAADQLKADRRDGAAH